LRCRRRLWPGGHAAQRADTDRCDDARGNCNHRKQERATPDVCRVFHAHAAGNLICIELSIGFALAHEFSLPNPKAKKWRAGEPLNWRLGRASNETATFGSGA